MVKLINPKNIEDLERIQKSFTKLILKEKYSTYSEALRSYLTWKYWKIRGQTLIAVCKKTSEK